MGMEEDEYKENYFGPGIVVTDVSLSRDELLDEFILFRETLRVGYKSVYNCWVSTGLLSNRINIGTGGISQEKASEYIKKLGETLDLIQEMQNNVEQFVPDKLRGNMERKII